MAREKHKFYFSLSWGIPMQGATKCNNLTCLLQHWRAKQRIGQKCINRNIWQFWQKAKADIPEPMLTLPFFLKVSLRVSTPRKRILEHSNLPIQHVNRMHTLSRQYRHWHHDWLQGFDHEADTNKSVGLIIDRVPGSVEIYDVDVGGGGGERNVKANISKTWGGHDKRNMTEEKKKKMKTSVLQSATEQF